MTNKQLYFAPDFTERWGYNSQTDYTRVTQEYNTLLARGDRMQAKRLLDEHGGKLALCMKREYQKQVRTYEVSI